LPVGSCERLVRRREVAHHGDRAVALIEITSEKDNGELIVDIEKEDTEHLLGVGSQPPQFPRDKGDLGSAAVRSERVES
jgi:hypothetical protein